MMSIGQCAQGFAVGVSLLCSFSGCVTTYSIRPDKLIALDGFNAGTPEGRIRVVEAEDGDKVEYWGQEMKLAPVSQDGTEVGGEFIRLDAREGLLVGALSGGGVLSLDPAMFKTAQVSYVSIGKTVALVTTILMVVGVAAVSVLLINDSSCLVGCR